MSLLLFAVACAAAGGVLTGLVRRFAAMDHPNERSSHTVPTPRGGGLAIAAVTLGAVAAAWAMDVLPANQALALAGGIPVAVVGWLDDHRDLRASLRLVVHLAAAAWALYWLGGLPSARVGAMDVHAGWVGWAIGMLGIVWAINFYNFMDGIDGIAGTQALAAAGIGAAILSAAGATGLAWAAAAVAGAALGFLPWNWQRARIFMGDVGSSLLGYLLAVLGIASERAGALPLLGWVVLLGPFVFDATVTLARRVSRGERVYVAHRNHAYQRLTQAGWSHAAVTLAYGAAAAVMGLVAWLLWARPAAGGWAALAALAGMALAYAAVERARPLQPPSRDLAPAERGMVSRGATE